MENKSPNYEVEIKFPKQFGKSKLIFRPYLQEFDLISCVKEECEKNEGFYIDYKNYIGKNESGVYCFAPDGDPILFNQEIISAFYIEGKVISQLIIERKDIV